MEIKFTDGFWDDCEKFGLARNKKFKFKYLYWRLIPHDWRPGQILYRLKCFLFKRYTTVHPRTLPYHTWCDRDHLLLHCCFELLCQFLEEECSPGIVNWDADESHRKAMSEMKELYRWWKEDYPKYDNIIDYEEEDKAEKETQKRLHRLINIRRWMWT